MIVLHRNRTKYYFVNLIVCCIYFTAIASVSAHSGMRYKVDPDISCNIVIDSIIPVTCFGADDAKLCFSVVSGNSPTYDIEVLVGTQLFNFESIATDSMICIEGLSGALFQITATGMDNCIITGGIPEPSEVLAFSNVVINSVSCYNGMDGSIYMEVTGGTSPYTYQWNNDSTNLPLLNVGSGNYIISVVDANGCSAQNEPITVLEPDEIIGEIQHTDVACFGNMNGTAEVFNLSGGVGDYSYLWNTNDTLQNLDSLAAGIYSLTITDANDCSIVLMTEVTAPNEIEVTESIDEVQCFGESNGGISLSIVGGTGEYLLSWSTGEDTLIIGNLSAGNYSYTIIDENECEVNNTITIDQPDLLKANATVLNNVSCDEDANGRAFIMPAGGTGILNAEWNNGSESDTLTGVMQGLYFVTITDDHGCIAIDSVSIEKEVKPIIDMYSEVAVIRDGDYTNLMYHADQPLVVFHWKVIDSANLATNAADYEEEGVAEDDIKTIFQLESKRAPGWVLLAIHPQTDNCTGDTVQTRVDIYPAAHDLFIPDLFTPNGDGANDNWEILFPLEGTADDYAIKIFNRSGGMIYERNGMAEQWDAAGCPDGVYYYVISNVNNDEVYKGAVTIMRK